MITIQIREPIWKSPRSVGLSLNKLRAAYSENNKFVAVEILAKDKTGNRLYPSPMFFGIEIDKIKGYKHTKTGETELIIVPISDLSYSSQGESNEMPQL